MESIFEFVYEFKMLDFYNLLNSQFTYSILGPLAGAFAGAIAAHKIASSAKKRESIENEIRAVNVSISTAFLICNSMLSLKKQHIESLYKSYMQDRENYANPLANPPNGGVIQFETNLKTIPLPHTPIAVLETNVYERVIIKGRPLALVSTIANSLDQLSSSLKQRNIIIDNFKIIFQNMPEKDKLDHYFGFPLPDGSVHQEYLDTLQGLYQYTDDVIFFSSLFCEDLKKHGNKLIQKYNKKKIDLITGFDFDTPEAKEIWPDEDQYSNWLGMFVEVKEKPRWYKRILTTNKQSKADA
jgi:hypothetical protein